MIKAEKLKSSELKRNGEGEGGKRTATDIDSLDKPPRSLPTEKQSALIGSHGLSSFASGAIYRSCSSERVSSGSDISSEPGLARGSS